MCFFKFASVAVFALMVFAMALPARAATPIEFEFGGVFTRVTNTVHQIGEPFTTTVRFDPAALDTDPSPLQGNYPYLRWTAPAQGSTPVVFEAPPANAASIQVIRGVGGADGWKVDSGAGITSLWEMSIDFPVDTFPTDALPPSLPFSQNTGAFFRAFIGSANVDLQGTINSLTVRVVPEPALLVPACAGALAIRRRSVVYSPTTFPARAKRMQMVGEYTHPAAHVQTEHVPVSFSRPSRG